MGIEAIDHWVLVVKDLKRPSPSIESSALRPVGKSVPAGGELVPSSASARRRS